MKLGTLRGLFDSLSRLPKACGGPEQPATFGTPVTCSATCGRFVTGSKRHAGALTESAGCLVVVACDRYLPHVQMFADVTPYVGGQRVPSATGRIWKGVAS